MFQLLAKVGLSDEIIAKLKPKNVDNMNEVIWLIY